MNSCAYCGLEGKATKEHIWPKTLIEKYEELDTYSQRTNRFFSGELVVKDVCVSCNSGPLSRLDSYLSSLFEDCFASNIEAGDAAALAYDYELLLRALLKISYNSSRTAHCEKSKSLHRKLGRYILKGGYHPKLMLRLQVVTAARAVDVEDNSERRFAPQLLRCGTLSYDGPLSHRFLVRMIAVNSFWFYVVMAYKAEPDHKWREFMESLSTWRTPVGVLVSELSHHLVVPVEKTTFFHPDLLGSLLTADRAD